MNSSLLSADLATHLKIVAVAIVAAGTVAMVGIHAKADDPARATAEVVRPAANGASLYSADQHSTIR